MTIAETRRRLAALKAQVDELGTALEPTWNPLLIVKCDSPGQWDEAVQTALAKAPTPPPGHGYLIMPAESHPDKWEAESAAEMSWMIWSF